MSIQKKTLAVSVVLFLVFGILTAQDSKKDKTAPASGWQVETNIKQDSAKDSEKPLNKKKVKINPQTAKESEPEEGNVLIDTTSSEEEPVTEISVGRKSGGDLQRVEPRRANISAYFGQLKGVLLESGRNILVFENDAGELTLVQVTITKNNEIICKTIGQIYRSME